MMYLIFYSDKTTYYGDDIPEQKRGVQAIVQKNRYTNWHTETKGDYYMMLEDGLWYAKDFDGLFTELKKRRIIRPRIGLKHDVLYEDRWVEVNQIGFHEWLEHLGFVLFGETIDNDRYQEILQLAYSHADFGRKQGYLPGERKAVK